MYDYIQIGAWRSDSVPDLHVLGWDAPLMPRAQRPASPLPGRMTAPEDSRRDWRPEPVTVTMALVGSGRAALRAAYRSISGVLQGAQHLILSDTPGYHYRGHTAEVQVLEDYEEWLGFKMIFTANPPCQLRVLGQAAGWIPTLASPPAEQITELNASHNLALTGPATVQLTDGLSPHPPEVHMLLLGSWDTLRIGGPQGLTIPGLPVTSAVWLDSEAMRCWDKVAGVRTPVPNISGSYEAIGATPQLAIDGTNLALTAHILVIERS